MSTSILRNRLVLIIRLGFLIDSSSLQLAKCFAGQNR